MAEEEKSVQELREEAVRMLLESIVNGLKTNARLDMAKVRDAAQAVNLLSN